MSTVLLCHPFLPEGQRSRWQNAFPNHEFLDARTPDAFATHHAKAEIIYGLPDLAAIPGMPNLQWIQLGSAGVPAPLCPVATERQIRVTNLAGLYGPTIAEHALGMMLILSRNLHVVHRNKTVAKWDRTVADTMRDLHGRTLGIVGLGNIGQNIARLGRALGMRVVGCRRHVKPTPFVDQIYECNDLNVMAAECDVLAVAAPLVRDTEGMLGRVFFESLRPGAVYINVSRGPIAQESALLDALNSGRLAGAGLDVFAVEPLPSEHPFWTHPNVIVSPHYSGETVNFGPLPADRFTRNIRNFHASRELEGSVRLELGY